LSIGLDCVVPASHEPRRSRAKCPSPTCSGLPVTPSHLSHSFTVFTFLREFRLAATSCLLSCRLGHWFFFHFTFTSTELGNACRKQIRSFDCVTPILFLSADVYPETQAEAFSAGAKAYLTKPVDPDVLKEMVRWLLDERTAGASR